MFKLTCLVVILALLPRALMVATLLIAGALEGVVLLKQKARQKLDELNKKTAEYNHRRKSCAEHARKRSEQQATDAFNAANSELVDFSDFKFTVILILIGVALISGICIFQ